MPLYADDPDVHVTYPITDSQGGTNEWPALVRVKDEEITAEWLGDPGPKRNLRVPLASLGAGTHRLRLIVPGDNDVSLGNVTLT